MEFIDVLYNTTLHKCADYLVNNSFTQEQQELIEPIISELISDVDVHYQEDVIDYIHCLDLPNEKHWEMLFYFYSLLIPNMDMLGSNTEIAKDFKMEFERRNKFPETSVPYTVLKTIHDTKPEILERVPDILFECCDNLASLDLFVEYKFNLSTTPETVFYLPQNLITRGISELFKEKVVYLADVVMSKNIYSQFVIWLSEADLEVMKDTFLDGFETLKIGLIDLKQSCEFLTYEILGNYLNYDDEDYEELDTFSFDYNGTKHEMSANLIYLETVEQITKYLDQINP